jgi:hydroxyethylthiazole kinase
MDHAAAAWKSLQAIREGAPLVHAITNQVAMETVANCLLAVGASPMMAIAVEEVEDVVAAADALVINIGTPTADRLAAMRLAASRAKALRRPWVLDPVGAGATPFRTAAAKELVALGPTVIRANASETLALAGDVSPPGRGVDSRHDSDRADAAATQLARDCGAVVAVTGAVDRITDGRRTTLVHNGDRRMTRVTALGCALSAVVGAFLAVVPDPLLATSQAVSIFGLAGERAAAAATGPGSLRWQIIDQLARLDQATLTGGMKLT